MNIEKLALGMFQANCYVVSEGSEAFLVDPGDRPKEVLDHLEEHGLKLRFILLTHGHVDHVNGVDGIIEKLPVPVYLHPQDRSAIDSGTRIFGELASSTIPVHDGMLIPFDQHEIKVIETPGHTGGGVSYLIGAHLFAGDTLFRHSIGRSDLPGGDYDQLIRSVRGKLYQLPDETIVYAGHEEETTIGHEKKYNMFVKGQKSK